MVAGVLSVWSQVYADTGGGDESKSTPLIAATPTTAPFKKLRRDTLLANFISYSLIILNFLAVFISFVMPNCHNL